MKIKDLNGKIHKFPSQYHIYDPSKSRKYSILHTKARILLHQIFPTLIIIEEANLPGTNLTADFYIPLINTMIEVNGEQHYKYIPFFHGDKMKFLQYKKNDRIKEEWCTLNEIQLIILPYDEKEREWEKRLRG